MKPKFRHSVIVPIVTLALCSAPVMQAAPLSWDGPANGVWGTAANWNPDAVPAAADDLTIFGPLNAPGALSISVEAAAAANSLNVTNPAATTLTTGGTDQTLTLLGGGLATGTGAVTVGANLPGQAVNIALAASQTWNVRSGGLTMTGTLSDGGTGFSLTKTGTGNLTLNPVAANTFTGGLALNGGTTTLNFANLPVPTDLVAPARPLALGGGTLSITGKNTDPTTQTLGNVTVNAGGGQILGNKNGGTDTNIILGSITATASGGSLLVGNASTTAGTAPVITTISNIDATGIYGGRITFFNGTAGTGYDWASSATSTGPGTPNVISAYSSYAALDVNGGSDTLNSTTAAATLAGSRTTNSLKFAPAAAAQTFNLGGNNLTLTNGGLLITGAAGINTSTISNGTLTAGNGSSAADLVVTVGHAVNNIFTGSTGTNLNLTPAISANITDNGANPVTLVKAGPGGLILSGAANTFTGGIIVNGGTMAFNTASAINNNAMTFHANATIHTFGGSATSGSITINNSSQLLILNNNSSFTVTGKVTGSGGVSVANGGQGAITVNLNAPDNDFTGPLLFQNNNATQGATISVASLVDAPAPGEGSIVFGSVAAHTVFQTFSYAAGAVAPLTLNNRRIELAGTQVLHNINNNSPQALTINPNVVVSGTRAKNLTLGGTGTGPGTLAGSIANSPNPTAPGTVLPAVRSTAATASLTLASVEGITVGSTISGTGITAGTTITAVNPVTRVVTLSQNASSIALGTVYTIPDVVNSISLTKAGTGTWVLANSNAYTGFTAVNAGVLVANHPAALGAATTPTIVASGASLQVGDGITVTGEPVTISAGGVNFFGALRAGAGNAGWAGPVTLGDANARVGALAGGTLTISGAIQGGAGQNLWVSGESGTGTVVVAAPAGTNTYTGPTNIVRGVLKLGAADALPVGTTLDVANTTATEDSTFDLNGFDQTVGVLQRSGTGTGGSFVTNSAASVRTLTVNQAATTTYSGAMQGNLALIKTNSGSLTLTGTNTSTGPTTVAQGALELVGGSHQSPITVQSGAKLGFTLGSPTTSTAALTLSTGHAIRITGTVDNVTNYTLMTASAITGTPVLESAIPGYSLVVTGGNTLQLNLAGASPYATWSGGAAFDADANNDGVSNGLAFLLGAANVIENATGRLPSVSQSGGNLTMTFSMLNAASRGTAVLSLQHSSDLGSADPWSTVTVPGVSGGPVGGVTFVITPGSPLDGVVATISSSEATAGKLSGRLRGQNP